MRVETRKGRVAYRTYPGEDPQLGLKRNSSGSLQADNDDDLKCFASATP